MKSFTETNRELGITAPVPSEWTAPNADNSVKRDPRADSGTAKLRTGNPMADNPETNSKRR